MGNSVEFDVLGPLEVRIGDRPVPVTALRQRTLLAALLLQANRTVAVGRLVEAMWGDQPPDTAVNQVAICVLGLRRLLAQGTIRTQPPGYLLRVDPGGLDIDRVEHLIATAHDAREHRRPAEAVAALRQALAQWRGPVLSGVNSAALRPEITRWEERRLAVTEECLALELELGRHHELIPELSAFVTDNPLREKPRRDLMVALYRAGRQAEALEVYRDAQRLLGDELGLRPSRELHRLEESILAGDPALLKTPGSAPGQSVPQQLPADIADFTGRQEQVARLRRLLTAQTGTTRAAPVCIVSGGSGFGATTVAVHTAHLLCDVFTDGQLYASLHDERGRPRDPAEVLARFLRALGQAVPLDTEERAALYRSVLADRQVLVVLDDAADEEQVRPLLPGAPQCGVLVTGASRMTGLAGAHLIQLGPLPVADVLELLAQIIGPARVARERAAAAELATLCDGIPLAVRIVGARLAAKPHWPLARLVGCLAPEQHRLAELTYKHLAIRDSLATDFHRIDRRSRQLCAQLCLASVSDLTAGKAAELLDSTVKDSEQVLEQLVDAHLAATTGVDPGGQPNYHIPDLVRLYARDHARATWHRAPA